MDVLAAECGEKLANYTTPDPEDSQYDVVKLIAAIRVFLNVQSFVVADG